MNIGLPGTGIGGLFYFFCALVMFAMEIARVIRRKKDAGRSKIARRVVPMLGGIIVSMLFLDWAVNAIITSLVPSSAFQSADGGRQASYQTLALEPILLSIITLGIILLSVHILKLIVRSSSVKS